MSDFKENTDLFGSYAIIPTDFSGEGHIYKIVSAFESNTWCETPIKVNSEPVIHKEMQRVVNVIHCGVDETKVVRVALKDCKIRRPYTNGDMIRAMDNEQLAEWIHNICQNYDDEQEPIVSIWNLYTKKEEVVHDSYGDLMKWLQSKANYIGAADREKDLPTDEEV